MESTVHPDRKETVVTAMTPVASSTGLIITPPPIPQIAPTTDEKKQTATITTYSIYVSFRKFDPYVLIPVLSALSFLLLLLPALIMYQYQMLPRFSGSSLPAASVLFRHHSLLMRRLLHVIQQDITAHRHRDVHLAGLYELFLLDFIKFCHITHPGPHTDKSRRQPLGIPALFIGAFPVDGSNLEIQPAIWRTFFSMAR